MKRTIRWVVGAMAVAVLGASCATIPAAQDRTRVESLLEELNTAPVERLVELTARPFLLDGEIVVLQRDIEMMWSNLRDVGFRFAEATVEEVGALTDQSYLEFGDTMDVQVWFERYTADDAGIARVRTSHGVFFIVIGEGDEIDLQIFGFTGPQE